MGLHGRRSHATIPASNLVSRDLESFLMAEGGALSDLTVIEYAEGFAAPLCGKMLADMGARVVKVEDPARPDVARFWGPFRSGDAGPESSGLFLHLNTGKRGLSLNLALQDGRSVLRDLVARADVFLEGWTPGHVASLGLGWDDVYRRDLSADEVRRLYNFHDESYAYSAIGNLTSKNGTSYTYGSSRPHAVTAVGSASYSYDSNGSMTSWGGTTVTWDVQNMVTGVGSDTYAYDGDGNRVKKIEGGQATVCARVLEQPSWQKKSAPS